MTKMVTLPDFLTEQEINRAHALWRETPEGQFAKRCAEEIIKPVLPRINAALGQENDPTYLAYMVTCVFSRLGRRLPDEA
jgi:hypothetical protein